jgi:hypothetical protein
MVRYLTVLFVAVTVWGMASAGGSWGAGAPWGAVQCDEEAKYLRTLIVHMKNTVIHLKKKLGDSYLGAKPGKKWSPFCRIFI